MKLRMDMTEGSLAEFSGRIMSDSGIRSFKMALKPLSPTDCRTCHTSHGLKDNHKVFGSFPDEVANLRISTYLQKVGTCHFGPALPPKTIERWTNEFKEKFGYEPVVTRD